MRCAARPPLPRRPRTARPVRPHRQGVTVARTARLRGRAARPGSGGLAADPSRVVRPGCLVGGGRFVVRPVRTREHRPPGAPGLVLGGCCPGRGRGGWPWAGVGRVVVGVVGPGRVSAASRGPVVGPARTRRPASWPVGRRSAGRNGWARTTHPHPAISPSPGHLSRRNSAPRKICTSGHRNAATHRTARPTRSRTSMAEHPAYPVGLRLAGRRVVVLGGGQVAQRRLPPSSPAGADIHLVSPGATPSVEAMADAGEIRWARRLRGRRPRRRLVRADRHRRPRRQRRRVRRGRAAPRLVRPRRRRRRGHRLDPGHRPQRGRDRRRPHHRRRGRDPRHTAAIRDAIVEGLRDGTLVAPHHRTRTTGVALVGGGPGDPDLITVRGRRLLAEADVVIADRLGPRDLLAELPPHVEVIDAAKIPYGRYMAQEAINNALIEHAKQGKAVVRLKGGDPYVFGRGMEEAQALAEAGIPCTVVPGISSSISVPGAAGIPVTHRGVAHEFTVVSGHVAPDDARSLVDWPALAQAPRHPRRPDGRRQDRQDRRHPRRARQVPATPRSPSSRRAPPPPSAASTPRSARSPRPSAPRTCARPRSSSSATSSTSARNPA